MTTSADKFSHLPEDQLFFEGSPFMLALERCHHSGHKLSSLDEYGLDEAQALATVESFAKRAALEGIPPHLWFSLSSVKGGYLGAQANSGRSVFLDAARRSCRASAFRFLSNVGATPWPCGILRPAIMASSASAPPCQVHYCPASALAEAIFPPPKNYWASTTQSAARFLLGQGLAGLAFIPAATRIEFIGLLPQAYAQHISKSSSTSSGVMGASDKEAKTSSALVASHAKALRAAALQHAPQHAPAIEALIAQAEALLAVKNKKSEAAFDPEALRKSLSLEQKQRLRLLMALCQDFPEDSQAWAAVVAATPWLAQKPQALCIKIGASGSVMQAALRASCVVALRTLDSFGANIWLAAAQAGDGNAVAWSSGHISSHAYSRDPRLHKRVATALSLTERLLAYGAFLDGAPDPIAHAVLRAQEASDAGSHRRHGYNEAQLSSLRANLEALALSDVLSGRGDSSSQGEGGAPARRSQRL